MGKSRGHRGMTPAEWSAYCRWRPEFEQVIDPRYWPIEWLDDQVVSGRAIFTHSENAAAVYEIKTYPTGAKDVHGLVCAGDLWQIKNLLIPAALERGRSLGCIGFLIESRPGWAKTLRSDGFEVFQVSVRREI